MEDLINACETYFSLEYRDGHILPFREACRALCYGYLAGLLYTDTANTSKIPERELGSREQIDRIAYEIRDAGDAHFIRREPYASAASTCESHFSKHLPRRNEGRIVNLRSTNAFEIQKAIITGYQFALLASKHINILPYWCCRPFHSYEEGRDIIAAEAKIILHRLHNGITTK